MPAKRIIILDQKPGTGWYSYILWAHGDLCNTQPLTIRAGETLEVVQSATAGTGNCSVLCVFTV